MASLPTSFSVTSTRSSPIPNPDTTVSPPSAKDAEESAVARAPELLAPSVTDDVTPPFPLNHARIQYDNKLQTYASITQNNTGVALNALKPNTWERWAFTVSGEDALWTVTLAADESFDTVCIGAHNLADIGATVQVNYDPEPVGGFDSFGSVVTPTSDNAPIMVHLSEPVLAVRIQIQVIGGNGSGYIGYISGGIALQMQRPFFNGHTPITDADVTRYFHNETESGEIIGQAVRSQGYRTNYEWQNLNDNWYRTYFAPFKQAIKLNPFFIAWNLDEYPQDVGFGRVAQDISAPMQNGGGIRRSVSFELLGHG